MRNFGRRENISRKITLWSFIFFLLFSSLVFAETQSLHPANKMLMKLYPRPFGFPYPSVPRISAISALTLYKTGQAVVIWIADDGKRVPGSLHFREMEFARLLENRKLEFLRNKLVIFYCN